MIPEKLTIQGIYSYQEKQTIDFKPLTDARLFGIFGHVGSGKSTILEAIIFALYGRTERIGNQGRNYNMMNLRSDKLFIDFLFSVRDIRLKATVAGRRNSKRFDDVKKYDRQTYRLIHDQWTPISQQELEDIIGLDYDNFKRSVIIPQGKFQEFIMLSTSDRTKMIRELFDLNMFELSDPVNALHSVCQAEIHKLSGQLDELKIPTDETVKQIKKSIKLTTDNLKVIIKTISDNNLLINELNNIKKLFDSLSVLKIKHSELMARNDEIDNKKAFIQRYDSCHTTFAFLLQEIKKTENKVTSLQKSLTGNKEKQRNFKSNYDVCNRRHTSLFDIFQSKETIMREAESADAIIKIRKLKLEYDNDTERIAKAKIFVSELEKEINERKSSLTGIRNTIKIEQNNLPSIQMLNKADAWFNKSQSLTESLNPYKEQVEHNQQEIRDLENNIAVISKNSGISSNNPGKSLQEEIQRIENALEKAQNEYQYILTQKKISDLATDLKEGEPCPLCGALSHPGYNTSSDLEQKIRGSKETLESLKTDSEALKALQIEINEGNKLITRLKNQNLEAQKRLRSIQSQIELHHAAFAFEPWNTSELLHKAQESYHKKAENIQQLSDKAEELTNLNEAANNKLRRAQEKLSSIETAIHGYSAQIDTLKHQHQSFFPKDYEYMTYDALSIHSKNLKSKVEGIEARYSESQSKLNQLSSALHQIEGVISEEEKQLHNISEEKEQLRIKLEEAFSGSDFSSVSEIQEILDQENNYINYLEEVRHFNDEVLVINSKLELTKKEIGDKKYDEQQHDTLIRDTTRLEDEKDQLNQLIGRQKIQLTTFEKNIEHGKVLHNTLEAKSKRLENLSLLRSLFRGSGFVNYISTVYLSQLVGQANERFQHLTGQHLKLELGENNEFLVRDFMNGGNLRSVKTLSGGQTFQCALSLALALSDSVQHRNSADHNFFFLDEGFGALDKEAMEVVFRTLKNLQKENRIVGVISHVDEMQQEIEMNLNVKINEQRGSLISYSWK